MGLSVRARREFSELGEIWDLVFERQSVGDVPVATCLGF
jgi:hypothetical protein